MSATLTHKTGPDETQADRVGVRRHRRQGRRRRTFADWLLLSVAIVIGLVIISPFLLVLINSFKSPSDYGSGGPLSLPSHFYVKGLENFWNQVDFPRKLWNSIFISGLVAVLGVVISALNAYAIGIGRVRGRTWIIVLFLVANILPQEALLYPLYIIFKQVGLYDSVWSVIIVFTVIQSAFGTYLLSSIFGTFPREILEAAELDGASRWNILRRVVVPISRPTLAVLAIFFFIWTWNEFLREAARHLAGHGHRRIALIGPPAGVYQRGTSYSTRFLAGFTTPSRRPASMRSSTRVSHPSKEPGNACARSMPSSRARPG